GGARAFGVHRAGLVPAGLVPQHVVTLGGARTVVDSATPEVPEGVTVEPMPAPPSEVPAGPTVPAPLGRVVGTRSGDKGGDANLGVFARTPEAWAWLDGFLTTDRLRQLLPEAADLEIERHPLPNLLSVNFVVRGLLGDGVAASTRQDGQAKSLGEWLRARVVDVPESLLVSA
ncbi:MAG: exopolyphosphatase, partial [Myxococcota bacterium]|nr:exopolyphosphatase [Myxococcota bacterium]